MYGLDSCRKRKGSKAEDKYDKFAQVLTLNRGGKKGSLLVSMLNIGLVALSDQNYIKPCIQILFNDDDTIQNHCPPFKHLSTEHSAGVRFPILLSSGHLSIQFQDNWNLVCN